MIPIILKLGTHVVYVNIDNSVKFCVIYLKGNWVIKTLIFADAEHIDNVTIFAL